MSARFVQAFCVVVILAVSTLDAQPSTGSPASFSLASGDIVRIAVWREPDLSGDFIVDERGIVTLPLLGQLNITSMPLTRLRDSLVSSYARQLRNPSVTITPLRRVYVLGEVMKPGLYPADLTMGLAAVVALAGGASPTGDLRKVRILRDGQVLHNRVDLSSTLSMRDLRSDDHIFVERRSWMDRNSAVFLSASLSAVTLILSVLLR